MARLLLISFLSLTSTTLATPFYQHACVTSPKALSWFHKDLSAGHSATPSTSTYQCFHGDITKYPSVEDWLSFDALWDINSPTILDVNNGDKGLVGYIKDAITTVSRETRVDARLMLALIMQESTGRANVACTHSGEGIRNCGLMQASYGSHAFDASNARASIEQMIREGVQGTSSGGPHGEGGPGYAQYLQGDLSWVEDPWTGNPYEAARAYNSGTVGEDLDNVEFGVPGYANDVAMRVLGWDGRGKGFEGCGT